MTTQNYAPNRAFRLGKLGLVSVGAGALITMFALGAGTSPSENTTELTVSKSPMQTGQTATRSAAPREPQTPKAVPGFSGPAPLPAEQKDARD